jgi:23S rRNA (cytidine2498-2'-O)-methyltransferase
MTHFYFALTNPEAESLLKLEIASRYKELRLSYGRPGFLTYKSESKVDFDPYMARLSGICLGRFKLEELNFPKAWFWMIKDNLIAPAHLQELSDKTIFKIGEKVTLIIMLSNEEFWVTEYILQNIHFQTPGEVSSIELQDVPSRAYYKIAEAHEAFDLPFDHDELVLELGSAPGGASLFLLEQDMRVIGVDPAEMDPQVAKKYNFRHWKRPFETLTADDFKGNVDWIVSDVNLPPTVVLAQLHRLLDLLSPQGLVITLKLNQDKHIELLNFVVSDLKKKGLKRVSLKYLPSHRREIALIALRS